MKELLVVNFSHEITATQKSAIEDDLGGRPTRVIPVHTEFDDFESFVGLANDLISGIDLDWETSDFLIILPQFTPIAALVLTHIHALAGYFPDIIRMRLSKKKGEKYEFAEVIELSKIRRSTRSLRRPKEGS